MAKPVSQITNFAALAGGTQPISLLDGEFANIRAAINDPQTYVNYAADTGTTNALICTFNPPVLTLAAGLSLTLTVLNANTGATTLNANGTGAKAVVNLGGSALAANQLLAGQIVTVVYDAPNTRWVVTSYANTLVSPSVTGAIALTGAAVVATPATNIVDIAALTTDGFGVAKSAAYFLNEAGTRWEFGGGAAKNIAGVGVDLASYFSATGTAGTDATAQIVKQITLKGNSLNAIGRGLCVNVLFSATSTTSIVTTLYLGTAGTSSDSALCALTTTSITRAWMQLTLMYASSSSVWVVTGITSNAGTIGNQNTGASSTNIAMGSDMFLSVGQANAVGTHITVFMIQVIQLG